MKNKPFICNQCDPSVGFKSHVDLKTHSLFIHGSFMDSCSTNINQIHDDIEIMFKDVIAKYRGTYNTRYDDNKISFAYWWLEKNGCRLPRKNKNITEILNKPLKTHEFVEMKRFFNLTEPKKNLRYIMRNTIPKEFTFGKELKFIAEEVFGLTDDYWINENNVYLIVETMIHDMGRITCYGKHCRPCHRKRIAKTEMVA